MSLAWLAAALALGGAAAPLSSAQETGAPPGGGSSQDPPPPQEPPTAPAAESAPEPVAPAGGSGPVIHGSLHVRNRLRWSADDLDDDLLALAAIDVGDPRTDRWTYHVLARGSADVDGLADGGDELFELTDTYGSLLQGRLYHAYADGHGVAGLGVLRLGRQEVFETPVTVAFDGLRAETEEKGASGLQAGAYGGIPVHPYESSPSGDLFFGLFGAMRPWTGGRARLDWLHLEDDVALGEHRDDLLGLRLWQSAGERLFLEGGWTMLEGDSRDLEARATWNDPASELVVVVSHYELFETQKQLSNELDPFFEALLELFPYGQTELSLAKAIGEDVTAQAGATLRRVRDDGDVGMFNRDFERYFLAVSLAELAWDTTLTVTGDLWHSPESDARSLGADLSREFSERTRASLGTYFALYKDDFFVDEERHDARTWYLRARRAVSDACSLEAAYEYEDSDIGWFQTLRVGATWTY